jgi:SnoaL-like domain
LADKAPEVHPFRAVWETHDLAAWTKALAPDVVAYSPMLTTPFKGVNTVAELYGVLFEALGEFEITHEFIDGGSSAFFWRANLGARRIRGVDLLQVDEGGKIVEISVWIRPLVDIAAFGSAVGPRLARKRGPVRAFLARVVGAPLGMILALVDVVAPRLVLRR